MEPITQQTKRKWLAHEIEYVKNNPHLSNIELAEVFNTTPKKVNKFKERIKYNDNKHLPIA